MRIRSGRRRRASTSLDAREASVRHSICLPWRRKFADCVPEPFRIGLEYVELRSHIHSGWWPGGLARAFQSNAIRADLTGGSARPKPQVTRVIGVFDPHTLRAPLPGGMSVTPSCRDAERTTGHSTLRFGRWMV